MSRRDDTAISISPARDEQPSARNMADGTHDGPVGRGLRQGLAHSAGLHLGNALVHVYSSPLPASPRAGAIRT